MKRVYISGPLRAPSVLEWAVNIFKAWCVARYYWSLGHAVFCPHLNTAFMDRSDLLGRTWIRGDLAWIRVSEVMIMMPGWMDSEGAKEEHTKALELKLEVKYLTPIEVWKAVCCVLNSPAKSKPRSWDFKKGD